MVNALNKSHCICYMNWKREATTQVEKYLFQTPLKAASNMEKESIRTYYCFKLRRSLSLRYQLSPEEPLARHTADSSLALTELLLWRNRLPISFHSSNYRPQRNVLIFQEANTRNQPFLQLGLQVGGCAAAAGKRDLQQRSLSGIWDSEFDLPSFLSQNS